MNSNRQLIYLGSWGEFDEMMLEWQSNSILAINHTSWASPLLFTLIDGYWQEIIEEIENEYNETDEAKNEIVEYEETDDFDIISTTMQSLHDDMPELTFNRILRDVEHVENRYHGDVMLRIYENETLIQEIDGLTQISWNGDFSHNALEVNFTNKVVTEHLGMILNMGDGNWYYWEFDIEHGEFIETETLTETTTQRIHDGLPTFTIHRRIGNQALLAQDDENNCEIFGFCGGFSVNLIIEADEGVLQEISGLGQVQMGHSVHFQDLTGNGYLDMILTIRADGAGALSAPSFFWLFNPRTQQFELNQRLTSITNTTHLNTVENGVVSVYARRSMGSGGCGTTVYFEYSPLYNDFLLLGTRDCIRDEEIEAITCSYIPTPDWIMDYLY